MMRTITLIFIIFLTGCSSPSMSVLTSPPGTNLDADNRVCSAEMKTKEHQRDFYTACMIARGYGMYFEVVSTRTAITAKSSPLTAEIVESSLKDCEKKAKDAPESGGRRIGRAVSTAMGALLNPIYFMDAFSPYGDFQVFQECMGDKYTVEPWNPKK